MGFRIFFSFPFFVLFLFVSLLCLLQLMCNCRWLWAVACGSEWVRGWVRARGSMGLTESCKDTRRLTNDTHRTSNTHTSTRAAYDTLKCIFFCCFPFDFALLLHPASGRWGVACWGNPPTRVLFYFFIFCIFLLFLPYLANFWRFTFRHVICFILFDGLPQPTPSVLCFPRSVMFFFGILRLSPHSQSHFYDCFVYFEVLTALRCMLKFPAYVSFGFHFELKRNWNAAHLTPLSGQSFCIFLASCQQVMAKLLT